jgi:NTP pyrophosphatase (non-canonical NTP hydrolase)
MRANSERWFPELHASGQDLRVFYALGMSGEVGEVANEVKKSIRGHVTNGVRRIEIGPELADVFTYLLLLADEYGVDLIEEYERKVKVNCDRWGWPGDTWEERAAAKYGCTTPEKCRAKGLHRDV